MKNEKLRHEKIARNKKRRIQRRKSTKFEHPDERKLRTKSFAVAGGRHKARKFRKTTRQQIADMIKNKFKIK